VLSLALLIIHAGIKAKWAKNIPAPIIVVVFAMALGAYFQLDVDHNYTWWGHLFGIHPHKVLVDMPLNPLSGMSMPDWGMVASGAFWFSAISIALVQGIETLLTAAAVSEKVDPWRRPVDLSLDVAAIGGSTIISGAIGGTPMIAEIVRSKANAMVGAKTRWSNFFHGLFILIFVLCATPVIDRIPVAALAALLVITGYRLAAPAVFKHTFEIGGEQLFIFCVTILVTLATDLLIGVATGVVVKLLLHIYHGAPMNSLFKCNAEVENISPDQHVMKVKGAAIFSNYIPMKKIMDKLPRKANVTIDLSQCRLVDHTVMDRLAGYSAEYIREGGTFQVVGLDAHSAPSKHPLAMRRLLNATN
jgi:MFS superfamily sulfate permease-like transporter